MLAAALFLAVQETSQHPDPIAIAPGDVVRFDLSASEPVLGDHGPCRSFRASAEFEGTLYAWARGERFRPHLFVEDEERELGASNRDRRTPFVRVEVEPGMDLVLRVCAPAPGESGPVELHVSSAPETAATRAAAGAARKPLKELEALLPDPPDDVRERLGSILDELLATPGAGESRAVEQALWYLGYVAWRSHDAETCRRANLAVDAFRSARLPEDHADRTAVLGNLGHALRLLGRLPESRDYHARVLAVRERVLEDDDPLLTLARQNLAMTLHALGEAEPARDLAWKVYQVELARLGPDHEEVQGARMNLALTLQAAGDLLEAQRLLETALEGYLRSLPEDHEDVQRARMNLGVALTELGDREAARRELALVHAARVGTLPEDDPGRLLSGISLAVAHDPDDSEALDLLRELHETFRAFLPADHPDLAMLRRNLGGSLVRAGDAEGARTLLEGALADLEASAAPGNAEVARIRVSLADALFRLGEREAAIRMEEEADAVLAEALSEDHPDLVRVRSNRMIHLLRAGRTDQAAALAHDLAADLARMLLDAAVVLSPRRAEALASLFEPTIAGLLRATAPDGALAGVEGLREDVFALVESHRGLGLLGSRAIAAAEHDPVLEQLRAEVRGASGEVVRLQGRPELGEAVRRKQAAQQALLERLAGAPAIRGLLVPLAPSTLADRLPKESVAVGFREYRKGPGEDSEERGSTASTSTPWLAAHVVRPGRPLVRVDLAPLADVEDAVGRWRAALSRGVAGRGVGVVPGRAAEAEKGEQEASRALRALVLDPLREAIGDAERLVVALDGPLHEIPLDAMAEDGGRVGDRVRIEVRSTLPERLERLPLPASGDLLALGGIDYDAPPKEPEGNGRPTSLGGAPEAAVRAGGAEEFPPLAGTREEVRRIAAFHEAVFDDRERRILLEDREASKARLEALAAGARVLHIATHGYFASAPGGRTGGPGVDPHDDAQTRGLSPLVLCGIALAGANRPADDIGRIDGVMTAEEVASLDLASCDLVVLSACDTGLGEPGAAGQGLASLRKALHMAGARSVVASLWKVPDDATKELMVEFYRRLWAEGRTKETALWEAKRSLRDAGRPAGEWAGWVLSGNPD